MATAGALAALAALLGGAGTVAAQAISHQVQPGDTLWGLSQSYYGQPLRWPEVQQRNKVREPRQLQPGTTLFFVDGRPLGASEALVLAITGLAQRVVNGAPVALQAGQAVQVGEMLSTGPGTFLTLGLPDGSRSVVPADSQVKLEQLTPHRVHLRLEQGGIESQVTKKRPRDEFQIRTRTVTLGVRGTRFDVRDDNGTVRARVTQGQVEVRPLDSNTPPFLLDAGQGAVLSGPNAARTGHKLLPAPRLLGRTEASKPVFAVEAVAQATGYHWRIADDDLFLAPLAEVSTTTPSISAPSHLQPGFYHLRATALDGAQLEGLPSDQPIYLSQRASTARALGQGRFELQWAASAQGQYRLELARDAQFQSPLLDMPGLRTQGATVGPLAGSDSYFWRVSESLSGSAYGQPFAGGVLNAEATR